MKKLNSFLNAFYFFLFMIVSFSVSAQSRNVPGYLITNENDTMRGFINDVGEIKRFKQLEFGKNHDDEKEVFYPGTIQGYMINESKFYVSRIVNDSTFLFVEYLVNGIADLYYYRDIEGPHYLIDKGDKLVELSNYEDVLTDKENQKVLDESKRTGTLNYFFSDCPEIQPAIEHVNLSHTSLIRLTRDYHSYECEDGRECIVYEKQLSSVRFKIGPLAGLYISNYHDYYPYMDRFEFSQSLHPELGFSLKMNLQRFSEKFNLYFEGTCGQINTQATASFTYGFRKDIHDISINYTYIKLVIPVSYSIQTGRLRPDFVCGMNTTWPISPDIDRVITVEGESSYDPVYSTPQVNKWYLGGMARAGVSYHFQNNEVIFLHLGYEFTTGMTSEYGADVNSSFVMAGYYF